MPSVLFLFHLCIHCLGEFFVQGFGHSEASVEFRLGSAFRVRVTNTVSGEFDYASGQGSVRAKRYGNLFKFAHAVALRLVVAAPRSGVPAPRTLAASVADVLPGNGSKVPHRGPVLHKSAR